MKPIYLRLALTFWPLLVSCLVAMLLTFIGGALKASGMAVRIAADWLDGHNRRLAEWIDPEL